MLPRVPVLTNTVKRYATKRWCRCLKITRRDGEVYRWTDHDAPVTLRVVENTFETFLPTNAPNWDARRESADFDANTASLNTFLDNDAFTAEDLRIGIWRNSVWRLYGPVDWRYPWDGAYEVRRYSLQDYEWTGSRCELNLAGIVKKLDVRIGRVFGRECDAVVGDSRCKVNLSGFTSGTKVVTAVTTIADWHPRLAFESTNTSFADDHWKHGHLAWITGNNAILGMNDHVVKLSKQVAGRMEFYIPTPYDIQVGDTFVVTAGCLKRLIEDCKNKFSNPTNHRGFQYLTNPDQVLKSPGAKS